MPLRIKWLLLWSLWFVVLLLWLWWPTPADAPPWPSPITQLRIEQSIQLERHDANDPWHSDGYQISAEQQVLIERWLADLRLGCGHPYPAEAILEQENTPSLTFGINGEVYRFGAFNTYTQRHYLYHDGYAYSCIPTLAPRLQHAHQLWITPNA